jgi:hypothetical protein
VIGADREGRDRAHAGRQTLDLGRRPGFGRAGQHRLGIGAALDQLVGAQAAVVRVEQRPEIPPQPLLDRLGQLARHQHHGLVGHHRIPSGRA